MKVDIRHSPSFAVAKLSLAPNEPVKVQPGAMMAMSFGINVEAKADGGILRGLGRMMAGENFLVSTFTAPAQGGWVDVIPEYVGDLFEVDVDANNPFLLTSGSWLANENSVTVDPDLNLSAAFKGEGLMILKTRGAGKLVGSTYGAIDVHSLPAGAGFTIDTGHLVAWESSLNMKVRKAGSWMNSWKSKEGLVVDVTGPGDVITQSRVPNLITQTTSQNNNFLGIGG